MKRRRARQVIIREDAKGKGPLETRLVDIAAETVSGAVDGEVAIKDAEEIDIGDAAVLMAIDGYGHARVGGVGKEGKVTVSTKQTKKTFLFQQDPKSSELFVKAHEAFESIRIQRHLEH